jgi:two-component system, chemotaxis family, CheB/CheR fusion protein
MAKKTRQARNKKVAAVKKAKQVVESGAQNASAPLAEMSSPIVGIGASAGGLEAFTKVLGALSTDTGMAFVLVQHLEPKHESALTAILSKATEMPVREVKEGMHVEANHVYVIPANSDMSVLDGLLHIAGRTAPPGRHLPIDYFFSSLAESRGPRAIGVVLSGTASDGTAGIKAIKAAGGVTFAQEPESARFDGMPRSAIASGCVDFVLTPERIAAELARLVQHPFLGSLGINAVPEVPAQEQEWARLFRLLRATFGVDFSLYKKSTVKRRLARRMAVNKVERLGQYLKILERSREELDALFAEILILVTSFFRDPEVFASLQKKVIPRILASKPAGEPVRVWVAGCSSGGEAYSIAMILLEVLGEKASSTPIQIFATDVSEEAIDKARNGVYPEDELTEVSAERKRRFFTRVSGYYQVNHDIREMCVFARLDVTRDPPFSRLDLLTCRNVLIYFEPPLQKRALAAFHYALRNHGVLVLGKTESLSSHSELFTASDRKNKFFLKNPSAHVPMGVVQASPEHAMPGKQLKESLPGLDLEKEADRMVWERYAHAGLVVNGDLQILHFRGDTSPYLRPVPGKATFQLMRMLREELALEVRAALQKSRRTGVSVRSAGIQIHDDQQKRLVNIEVRSLQSHTGGERSYLILFEEASSTPRPARKPAHPARERQNRDSEITRLENELARTREYVQAIIRDQETTNEELKTANEEAMSSMEELQSTNEELETAKEELQSSNEELVTLNEQLQNRNTELAHLSDDLSTVLTGVDIPIVILGSDRRIRRFTPPAEKLLGLIPADVGRPIGKLRIGMHIPDFDGLISAVMAEGRGLSREVQAEAGGWFQLRVRPFRTGDDEGVVMAFMDIHELKTQQDALLRDRNFTSSILDSAADLAVVVLDPEGRITHFNRVAQHLSGYSLEEAQGQIAWEFLATPEESEAFREAFESAATLEGGHHESHWIARSGRPVLVGWSYSAVRPGAEIESVVFTGVDRTGQQDAEQKAEEGGATIRALLETAAEAILAVNGEGRVQIANSTAAKMFDYSRTELAGKDLASLLPEATREQLSAGGNVEEPERARRLVLSATGRRRDGSEFPVETSVSVVETHQGPLTVFFISDITERREAEQTLIEYQEQLRRLTASLFNAQEYGNRELARELHDGFSQQLAAVSMEISQLLKRGAHDDSIAQPLEQMGKKISRMADDMHRASRRLHPAMLEDLGLGAALRDEGENFFRETKIPVAFHGEIGRDGLSTPVALCLFRVAQEALRNVRKHTKATVVDINLARTDHSVELRIKDNGTGFDLEAARKKAGLGLISMEERVRLVSGKLTIRSPKGKGTTVEVTVPLS